MIYSSTWKVSAPHSCFSWLSLEAHKSPGGLFSIPLSMQLLGKTGLGNWVKRPCAPANSLKLSRTEFALHLNGRLLGHLSIHILSSTMEEKCNKGIWSTGVQCSGKLCCSSHRKAQEWYIWAPFLFPEICMGEAPSGSHSLWTSDHGCCPLDFLCLRSCNSLRWPQACS